MNKSWIYRFSHHLHRVLIHKWYVFQNCCYAGIPWRGLIHDLSKFSYVEFSEGVIFYDDKLSPYDNIKKKGGYSYGRLHHKGRNKHHWEYWVDIKDNQLLAYKMPYKYMVEMLCDWLGAERAYRGVQSMQAELDYWNAHKDITVMHPETKQMITVLLELRAESNNFVFYRCIRDKDTKYWYENKVWRKW